MKPTTVPYLSHSRVSTYLSCGEKYRLYYVEQVPRQASGFFLGGIAIHDTIEDAEQRGDLWGREDGAEIIAKTFTQQFERQLERVEGEVYWGGRKTREHLNGEDEAWWRVMGPIMLKRYLDTRRWDQERGYVLTPTGTEMQVGATLPSGRQLTTRIDAFVMTDPDGQRMVRDWKTGKIGGAGPMQLATYAWAVRQAFGITPAYGQIVYLRSQGRDRREENVDIATLIDVVPRIYADAVQQIESGFFPLRPSAFCKSCSVKDHCIYGKTI